MAVRITHPDDENVWIEYKETGWTFGKRRKMMGLADMAFLTGMLDFVVNWHIQDADGKAIPFEPEKGLEIFDEIDDLKMLPWIIGSWWDARRELSEVSKNA